MLDRWTDHLTATRSPGTVREYTAAVRFFQSFCVERGFTSMNTETLQAYVNSVSRVLAPRTVHQRVAAIREYFKFCGYEPGTVKLPTVTQGVPRHLDSQQLAVFMDHANGVGNAGVRAVLKLLPLTGLRIRAEMLRLTLGCIQRDATGAYLRFAGKRGKVREVPLVSGAEAVLMEYLTKHRQGIGAHDRIFVVSYRAVYDQLVRIRTAMDCEWLHPHVLRHTFATMMRENDVDMADIQDLLGHSRASTTAMYAHATRKTRRSAVERGLGAKREAP